MGYSSRTDYFIKMAAEFSAFQYFDLVATVVAFLVFIGALFVVATDRKLKSGEMAQLPLND